MSKKKIIVNKEKLEKKLKYFERSANEAMRQYKIHSQGLITGRQSRSNEEEEAREHFRNYLEFSSKVNIIKRKLKEK